MSGILPALLSLAGGVLLAAGWWLALAWTPAEAVMGDVQKIFYVHLPLAWWALASFFAVFVCSILRLATKRESLDRTAAAFAEVGVLLATLCLATGVLWGRRAWGVWWTWDPRLTTALVMWFVYMGYLLLGSLGLPRRRLGVARAVLGVVAFADVPLVFLSARMWRSIHPAVFGSGGGGMEPEMLFAALFCCAAMGLLWLGLVLVRRSQLEIAARADALLLDLAERTSSRDGS